MLSSLLVFITAVAVLRLVLYEALGMSWIVRVISVTVAVAVSVLLGTFLMYTKRFGGYANVLVGTFLLVTWGHILIVLLILVAVLTGSENVFSAAPFSPPQLSDPVRHIVGHLTFGIGMGNIVGGAVACLFFFLLRRFARKNNRLVGS